MIDVILWYIWMVGRAYLGVGITTSLVVMVSYYHLGEEFTLKDIICIILFHPIVAYYFIKELIKNHGKFEP